MNTYSEIVTWYRLSRPTMPPPPHPGLTRAEAVLYRQLQTHSVLTPAFARYVCPEMYETDICRLCKDQRATLAHILWQCNNAATVTTLPQEIEDAKCSANLDTQLPGGQHYHRSTGATTAVKSTPGEVHQEQRPGDHRGCPGPGSSRSWDVHGPPIPKTSHRPVLAP
ncbi:hypothetical protein HPB48_014660 [Haemaphysalis longicornis]|uniref:Tick transposon n=1 Tax=Haemaphysalis longicornis TaxID=44386 RepID=A0A9J6GR38_HAELO|nr:hypothetical protein HPB48_014660 [Haemaphysalis longicornis]